MRWVTDSLWRPVVRLAETDIREVFIRGVTFQELLLTSLHRPSVLDSQFAVRDGPLSGLLIEFKGDVANVMFTAITSVVSVNTCTG